MRKFSLLAVLAATSIGGLAACGGSTPPPEEPKAEEKSESAADEAKAEETADSEKKDGGDAKKEEPRPETSGPAVTRTAKDILTAPEVTFMFSFNDSEPKEQAEEKCRAQSKDDPKKNADCMTKARSKFQADGMQFKKDDKGQWVWLTLRRKGNTLTNLHKIAFEFGSEKATSVTLKLSGKDTGKTPMRKVPSEVTIEVPNEFQIAMQDPEHGRLVYEAKIGITSDSDGKASGAATR